MRRFQEEMARRRSEEARRIGARIAALRERHHLTQEAAAAKLKVAYRTYQSWEQGTAVPRWATRERIAKFYGVSVEEVNGPATPVEDASADRLDRIEERLDELVKMLSPSGETAEVVADVVDQLDAAAESPPSKAPVRSGSRRGGRTRKSA